MNDIHTLVVSQIWLDLVKFSQFSLFSQFGQFSEFSLPLEPPFTKQFVWDTKQLLGY